jgi:ABC-2 type transport system permease protein
VSAVSGDLVPAAASARVGAGLAALIRAGFRRWATYRQATLAGAFTNSVFGLIKISILLATARAAGGVVAGYDRAALSTYTWLSQGLIAVVVVFSWTELADRIRTGDLAIDLARPVDLQLSWLAEDLGRAGFAATTRLVFSMLVGAVTFGVTLPHRVDAWLLFAVSVPLAVVISFGCRFLLNLVAIWLLDVRGVVTLYVLVSNLLCGLVIPVQFFPGWLGAVAHASPFPSMLQAPIDVFTGRSTGWRAVAEVAVQVAWAAALLLAGRLVLRRAVRKLVVQGG